MLPMGPHIALKKIRLDVVEPSQSLKSGLTAKMPVRTRMFMLEAAL
jgi:hypothetical protein